MKAHNSVILLNSITVVYTQKKTVVIIVINYGGINNKN